MERIMSIINIAVGLMRSPLPQELEKKISGANNIKQIRQACDTNPELESALMDGMQPVKTLLESLFVD